MKRILYLLLCICLPLSEAMAQVKASFTANVVDGCPPLLVQFNGTSSTGGGLSYKWNLGNGATVATTNATPSTTYHIPGVYTVSLTVTNANGTNTETKTNYIIVRDTPKISFTATPLVGCPGTKVDFTNSTIPGAGSASYSWYFGDGGSSNGGNPSHVYNNSGLYKVQLYATNSHGCKKLFERPAYINIYERPSINFTADKPNICAAGTSVNFTGSATGVGPFTYSWKFGDGGTASGQNVSHIYNGPAPKKYTVELTVTDGRGCVNKIVKTDYINLHAIVANFTAPDEVCVGFPVTFGNTSTGDPTSQTWTFGDSHSSTGVSPTHTYHVPGNYTVKLVVEKGGCLSEKSKVIKVNPQPNADFTYDPPQPCPAPISIKFTPNGTYADYWWNLDGPVYTVPSPTHVFTQNKKYNITFVATDAKGCKDTATKEMEIYSLGDTLLADKRQGCVPLTITFTAIAMQPEAVPVAPAWYVAYPYGVANYHWNFGDGNTANTSGPNTTHTYLLPGVYRVISTITTVNGCTARDTMYVRAGTKPTASFLAPSRVCHREIITFIHNSPPPANGHYWNFGDFSPIDTFPYPIHQYKPGTYTAKYVSYYNGCPSDTAYKTIIVDSPDAALIIATSCHPDSLKTVRFTNQSMGATWWKWDFGDGNTSLLSDPVHTYANFGTYAVRLVAFNANSNCYDTIVKSIDIISPHARITANDSFSCVGDTISFGASIVGSAALGYAWTTTLGYSIPAVPKDANVRYVFTDTGVHTVTTTVYDANGCPHDASRQVFISKPKPRFVAEPPINCAPANVLFRDSSTGFRGIIPISTRRWDFGNGMATNTPDTFYRSYPVSGSYTVKLVVTDTVGCTDSLIRPSYVAIHRPKAVFTADDKGCVGAQIGISNQSTDGIAYRWDFGNGDTSVAMQPLPVYKQPGTYTITLVVRDQYGCRDTAVKTPGVAIQQPKAGFVMTDSAAVCPPLSVKFTSTSTGAQNISWRIEGGGKTGNSINYLFTQPGNIPVVLIATDALGCVDSMVKYVNILGYTGGFTYTPLFGCAPLEVEFTSNISGVPYAVWDFNDGNTLSVTAGNTKHIYTFPGKFTPKMIFTDGKGCTGINPGKDEIVVDDVVAAFTSGPLCEYQTVEFLDSSYSYFSDIQARYWKFHTGNTSFQKAPKQAFGATGKYPVMLAVINKNGCKDTLYKEVFINPSPVIDAGADTVICLKDSATLVPSGGVSYTWLPATYLSCTGCTNPKAGPPKYFTYTVEGTDANGCKNTDTVAVNIKTKVTTIVGSGGEICQRETLQLNASGASAYEWIPAAGLNNNRIPDPVASPEQTTHYYVISYEGSCLPDTDLVKVVVHPLPTVTAKGEHTIVAGEPVDLQASGSLIRRFEWTPAESLSCADCAAPTARPTQTTTYTVRVYTDFGCSDSDRVTVTVLCDQSQVFVPNTFTPNGDGQNDVFYPRGAGLGTVRSFRIYNRWGQLVFERRGIALNDESSAWDGTFKGELLSPDAFAYVLEVFCDNGELMNIKGDVTIIR